MAGFRGFGDDAMKVAADQRQHAAQMAQIAAQERASRRSAAVAMAGQAENARQADMQLQARKEELQAGRTAAAEENAAQRSFTAGQADLNRAAAAEESGAQRAFQAEQAGLNRTQDDILRERQLAINESTFARMKDQWDREDAAKAEYASQENAATLAAMRLVAGTGKNADTWVLDSINLARGVKTGDPGSLTKLFPVKDDQGSVYGWGAEEVAKDGSIIQKAIDPADKLPIMREMMGPQAWESFGADLMGRGKDDKMTFEYKKLQQQMQIQEMLDKRAAAKDSAKMERAKYAASVSPQRLKQLTDTESELDSRIKAAIKRGEQPNPEDTQRLEGISRQVDEISRGAQEGEDLGVTPPAETGAKASLRNGRIVFTVNGQTATMPDNETNRNTLRTKWNISL